MEVTTRIVVLILLLAGISAPHWRALREIDPRRRLFLIAGCSVLGLLTFFPIAPAISAAVESGTPLPIHQAIPAVVGSVAAAFALGLVWSAVLDDSHRRAARIAVISLAGFALLLSLLSIDLWPLVCLPLALRTGWARSLDRRWSTICACVIGLAALFVWPQLRPGEFCWPPVCNYGVVLARLTRTFLIAQMFVLSVRLIFGVMFGPRRIGRRLLVSHLLIGVLPVALTGLFVTVMALLAIANIRANLATRVLQTQHAVSQQMLAHHLHEVLGRSSPDAPAPAPDTWRSDKLVELATHIGQHWPRVASWLPSSPTGSVQLSGKSPSAAHAGDDLGCLFVAIGLFDVGKEDAQVDTPSVAHQWQALLAEITPPGVREDGSERGTVRGWIYSRGLSESVVQSSEGEPESRSWGDLTHLGQHPPPLACALRPGRPGGYGLIKCLGQTFHATDYRVAVGEAGGESPAGHQVLRVQVIEQLPAGRTRILSNLFDMAARIHEGLRVAEAGRPDGAPGRLTVTRDTLATPLPEESRASSYQSSYNLAPAQEWHSAGAWKEIYLSVLGLSHVMDLIPQFPRIQRNPLELLPFIILVSTALLFILVETATLVSVVRTGRAIGQSVSLLRVGTDRLRQGDFAYRIPVRGKDELAELGEAFNDMARGLEVGRRHEVERQRLEGELELARQIQERLLPGRPPVVDGCALAGVSLPARQVGGDYYDFITLPDKRLLFVMADVSGKGAPAALLMSSIRAALHSMPTGKERPEDIVARLNDFIHTSTSVSEFVTLFLGLLDGGSGTLTYVNAGHDPPYLVRSDQSLERLTTGGLILGAFPGVVYEDVGASMNPGDTLFLYTDGLSEALNINEEMFGEERIRRILKEAAGQHPDQILEATLAEVQAFAGDAEPSDDITLLAIQRLT